MSSHDRELLNNVVREGWIVSFRDTFSFKSTLVCTGWR